MLRTLHKSTSHQAQRDVVATSSTVELGEAPTTSPTIPANTPQKAQLDVELAPQYDAKGDDGSIDKSLQQPDAFQGGVNAAEATTLSWSRFSLAAAFINMWCLYCVNAFQASIVGNLTPFAASDFEAHSLITVIAIVSNVMSGAFYLPVAKTLDLWGRAQGFLIMTAIATLGLILTASCNNIQTYAAAQVFYSVGFTGMIFSIDVITADSSTLRSRGLAYAFTSSPYMVSAFPAPIAAQSFYEKYSWRWGVGCFAIILPVVAAPLWFNLWWNLREAQKSGIVVRRPGSGRTWMQSIWYYAIEFDLLGVLVLSAGFIIFLLPFSLADSAPQGYATPYIIAMIILGILLLISFAFVERYAKTPFVPWNMLVNRTLLGVCLTDAVYQIAYYCWDSYFSSYCQVVYGLSITQAGWIGNAFDVVSGFWLFVVGFAIRYTGRFRWLFWCAVPLYMLAQGLMIYFRKPDSSIGLVVMCQVFIALGGGTMIICQQVGVLAVAEHDQVAAVLALLGLFGYMGGAVGNAISGAIWTNTLPQALAKYLPESAQADLADIYNDLDTQLSYAMGSPVRDAIIKGYAEAQTRMLIAGTSIMTLALICVLLVKDINVAKIEQVKGMLF